MGNAMETGRCRTEACVFLTNGKDYDIKACARATKP